MHGLGRPSDGPLHLSRGGQGPGRPQSPGIHKWSVAESELPEGEVEKPSVTPPVRR